VSHKADSDKSAYNFWEVIENSLKTILGAAPDQQYVINKLTGTIVVTASKKNLERVEQYLELTKKVIGRQVLVEAKIIEITLSDNLKFGLDWEAIIRQSGVGTITIASKGFSNVVPATSPVFNITTTANDFSSVLNTIQQLGEVRVLSNPRVSMMNGQASLLCVGRKQSFISKSETSTLALGTSTQQSFTVETSSVLSGIIIGIVPNISESGEISLTITPITSDLVKLTQQRFGGVGSDSTVIDLPTVDIRELSTTVKVRNGQMVIIGGLISKKEQLNDDQVPVLADIPLLGNLLKRRDNAYSRSEMVVLLQPVIVSN